MKYLNKTTYISFILGLLISFGIAYAASNITTLTQTAFPGDKLTSTWTNAVNSKLNTAVGNGSSVSCFVNSSNGFIVCIFGDGTCKYSQFTNNSTPVFTFSGYKWGTCVNALSTN